MEENKIKRERNVELWSHSLRFNETKTTCQLLRQIKSTSGCVFFPSTLFFVSLSLSRSTSYKLSSIVHKIHVKKRTRILMNTRRVRIASPWECRTLSFPLCMCVCAYGEHFSVSKIKEMRISHVWITFHAITDLFFTTILLLFMIAWNVYIVCVRECVCVCICVCNNRLAQCMSANVYRCGSMRSYWIPLLQSYTRTHISIRWKCLFSMHVI